MNTLTTHQTHAASKVRYIDEAIKIIDVMYEACKHDNGTKIRGIIQIESQYAYRYRSILSVSTAMQF